MEIKILKNIMSTNEKLAEENRKFFNDKNIKVFNIMASPGAGKTSILLKLIEALKDKGIYIIEGDTASSIDAGKISDTGTPVVQINTGDGCHLDAGMIKSAVESLALTENALLFIENIGNLICPSAFDLGETIRIVIASVPEGHDKPYKYIAMFAASDVVVLNKIDLLPYIDFDMDYFHKGITAVNPKAPLFEVSCRTGEGIDKFAEWIRGMV